MKKLLSILLSIILIISICPLGVFEFTASANENIIGFAGGSGTADDPYLLSTVEHLYNVRNYMSSSFRMTNDIDLTEATATDGDWSFGHRGWNPIGSGDVYGCNAFSGTFDGNNHSIIGMRIQANAWVSSIAWPIGTKQAYVGLFADVTGTVKNLSMQNVFIEATYNNYDVYVGAIAARASGRIENCRVYADDIYGHSNIATTFVGGLVGRVYGAAVINKCCVNATNRICACGTNSTAFAGGICALSEGEISRVTTITNSYNNANVVSGNTRAGRSNSCYAGGIVSWCGGAVSNCYNTGNIYVTENFAEIVQSPPYACAIAYASTTGNYYWSITGCYYLSGTGAGYYGSTELTAKQAQLQSLYSSFDFENVWIMDGDPDYPYPELRCFTLQKDLISSGTCGDNLTWTLDSEGLLTISGTGKMYDYNYDSLPWDSYRDSIKTVEIQSGVTSIGDGAFYGCTGLTSVTIPDSVTSIGKNAFYNCTGLTSITIPNSVTSIGGGAFQGCTGLTSVTIGNSVESIGDSAFSFCSSLASITIPDGVTSIGGSVFRGCSGLTSITIPDSVTSRSDFAFYGCTGLTSVTIGNGVTTIGSCAFGGCARLTSITIPDGVTFIAYYAFADCTELTSITIPDSITSIGSGAFSGCSNLNTVYYSGTESQRNQISIGINNTCLTNAEWMYNCKAEKAEKCKTLRKVYLKTAIQKKSGAKPTDSSYNLRLISMLDGLNDYSEVGFYITIAGYNDGENDEPIKYSTDTVYTSFLNGGTRVKASDYGAEYFTIVNMTVPNEYYSANIKIKPYIVFTDGSEFSGNEINTTVSKYIK